jgi:hypothetical protein
VESTTQARPAIREVVLELCRARAWRAPRSRQTGQSSGQSSAGRPGVNGERSRLLLLDFGGELPKQTGRERPHVEGLPRFEFELLRLLVARAVEHRLGDANRQARCSGCASSASSTRWKTSSAGCSPALRRSTAFFCTCGAAPP